MSAQKIHFLHQIDFPIRWGDMDALGHVNNIMYFRYFEQVRLAWYEQTDYSPLAAGGEGFVIVDNHAEYLKPLVYPMHVTLRMGGHSPGRSSFISTYDLYVGDELYTRGTSKIVWLNNDTGKSIPLPDVIRAMVSSADPMAQEGSQTDQRRTSL